jgi:hypothetical protein
MMKYKLLKCFALFLFIQGLVSSAKAQDEKFKAIFVYNFTKHINWPVSEGDFMILVLGSGNIVGEIEQIALKKTVGNQPIKINRINSPGEINRGHILYITSSKNEMLPDAFALAKKKNILLVTEKSNACRGGSGINFVIQGGKLGFEISKSNIESCGLGVSSDLLKLGTAASN